MIGWLIAFGIIFGILPIYNGFISAFFLFAPILLGWCYITSKIWGFPIAEFVKNPSNFINEDSLKKGVDSLRKQINTPGQPRVVFWFKIYCLGLAFVSFILLLLSFKLIFDDVQPWGASFFLSSIASLIVSILPIYLPRKDWVWIFNLTVLGISLTNLITIPVGVPLIVLYAKPEVRKFYRY